MKYHVPSVQSCWGHTLHLLAAADPLMVGSVFFKCCISTCSQPNGPSNVYRKYTLERMFTSQLLECAKDELMFRTLVRDLNSKAPALQIVILNPNCWSYSSCCSNT
ncbi:unnamed protein product [Rhodiola kirilowii]